MKPLTENRMRALAARCETAQDKRCKCRCGGAQHGMRHSEQWIIEEVQRDRLRRRNPGQIDWIGHKGYEHLL